MEFIYIYIYIYIYIPRLKRLICPTIAGKRIPGFIPFSRVLALCEIQTVSSRTWTQVTVFISYGNNHDTTSSSKNTCMHARTHARTHMHTNAYAHTCIYIYIYIYARVFRGACSVMVIAIGNKHSDLSSNPGWYCLYFTKC